MLNVKIKFKLFIKKYFFVKYFIFNFLKRNKKGKKNWTLRAFSSRVLKILAFSI